MQRTQPQKPPRHQQCPLTAAPCPQNQGPAGTGLQPPGAGETPAPLHPPHLQGAPPGRDSRAAPGTTLRPCSVPGGTALWRCPGTAVHKPGTLVQLLMPGADQTSGALACSIMTHGSTHPGRRSPRHEGNQEPPACTRSDEAEARLAMGSSEGEQTTRSCRLVS